jgi:hypothetical protein
MILNMLETSLRIFKDTMQLLYFKFQEEMRHLCGLMLLNLRRTARYAQLYFMDTFEATNIWMQHNYDLLW